MSGRIRTVKPEWLEDEKLAAASDSARLLSVALLLVADDHGRGRANVLFIASRVWAYVDHAEAIERSSRGLRELQAIGYVVVYEVSGQAYFAIKNWTKHQKVDHPSKPRIPPPDEADLRDPCGSREVVASFSAYPRESLAPDPDLRSRSPIPTSTGRDPVVRDVSSAVRESLREAADGAVPVHVPDRVFGPASEQIPVRAATPPNGRVTGARVALAYDDGWQEHFPNITNPRTGTSGPKLDEAAGKINRQARLNGIDPQAMLVQVMAAFWRSDSARRCDFAPGAIAGCFTNLVAPSLRGSGRNAAPPKYVDRTGWKSDPVPEETSDG